MRIIRRRVLLPIAIIVLAALLGTLAGYWLATSITLRYTESKLYQYTTQLLTDMEASAAELRTVLAAVDQAPDRQHKNEGDG